MPVPLITGWFYHLNVFYPFNFGINYIVSFGVVLNIIDTVSFLVIFGVTLWL